MQFRKLANSLIREAKGEKPGQRYHNARSSEGPAGMSSSPIGRGNYNPQIIPNNNPLPKDFKKEEGERNTEITLRNAFRLIKGDAGFRKIINKTLEGFAKKRKSITSAFEKVLTLNPNHIDKLYGQKMRLERIIAALGDDKRATEYITELTKIGKQLEDAQAELDLVLFEVQDILGENEDTSTKYQDTIIELIQATAEEQYDMLVKNMSDEEISSTITLTSLDQLDSSIIMSDEDLEQEEIRIKLLSLLLSENEEVNPLYKFFYRAQENYQRSKESDSLFSKTKAFTQNITVESFFNRLPVSAFASFYNATRDDLPLRPLTGARRKQVKAASPVRELLNQVTDDATLQANKDELLDLITRLDIDAGRVGAIQDILNGPYKRRGATVTQRLQGLLRGVLKEGVDYSSFDLMLLSTLSKYDTE